MAGAAGGEDSVEEEYFKKGCVAGFGGLVFGYQLGVSGGVTAKDVFLKTFFPNVYYSSATNQCPYNNAILLTLFTSSLYLAALVSCLCASIVTRVLSRRATMLGVGLVLLVGALVNAYAHNVEMLIGGRLILGFVVGYAMQAVPYLSPAAPYSALCAHGMLFPVAITMGTLIAGHANYMDNENADDNSAWRFSLGWAAFPVFFIVVGSFFLYADTPNSLIERDKLVEAKALLVKLRGTDNVDQEFHNLVMAKQQVKHDPWKLLLTLKYRPQLIFAICIPAFQQLTGISVITLHAPVLFKTLGFGTRPSLDSALLVYLVSFLATIAAIFLTEKRGRRYCFLEGGVQMFIAQVAVGCLIMTWKFHEPSKGLARVLVFLICVYVSGFAWSWGYQGWLVPSDIFPVEVRSAARTINISVTMIFTFAMAQVFPLMLCHMKFGLFFLFSFFVFVMSCFIYRYLPETRGIPIKEMERVWEQHPVWYVVQDQGTLAQP